MIRGGRSLTEMKSELFAVLRKLLPAENQKLMFFLKNPYFSHNKNLSLLFEALLDFYPTYELSEMDRIKIFHKIYGISDYNDSTFRSLMHLLLISVEDFIAAVYTIKNNVNPALIF